MKSNKKSLGTKIISALMPFVMTLGFLVMFMPTTHAAATSVITSANFLAADAKNYLAVYFTEGVCADADCTEALTIGNFEYYDGSSSDFASIASVSHTAGNDWALLTMDAASAAGDTSDKIRADEVYTVSGMILSDSSDADGSEDHVSWETLAQDTTAPTVLVATSKVEKTGADKACYR